jgi:AraC-like DNA-binding protein
MDDPTGVAFWEAAGREWWVEVVSAVEFHCAPEWHVLPRTIPDYMLWYVRSGVATLAMEGQEYPLLPGDILLVAPGVVHSASHDPARPLWTVTTHFTFHTSVISSSAPPDVLTLTVPAAARPPVRCSTWEPHVFDSYFTRLLTLEAARPPGWRTLARTLLLTVLCELWRENAEGARAPVRQRSDSPAIAEAVLRLEAEGQYFATPRGLAAACGFSPGYFSRLFRRQFACSPQQYLLARRIAHARHLLLESDLSIHQVARALGYRDVFFFTRQFRRHVGQPPAAFRRAARPVTRGRLSPAGNPGNSGVQR